MPRQQLLIQQETRKWKEGFRALRSFASVIYINSSMIKDGTIMHDAQWENQTTALDPGQVICNYKLRLIDLLIALCATEIHL